MGMKSQFGWMGERENGVMKLESRLGPDPIGFISQGKEFGFHSNCDGSHWMAVTGRDIIGLKFVKVPPGCLALLFTVTGHGWPCMLRFLLSLE